MNKFRFCTVAVLAVVFLFGTQVSMAIKNPEKTGSITIQAREPEAVTQQQLSEGLACRYYLDYFKRNLKFLPKEKDFAGIKGKPIKKLDHQFGKKFVFDSGTNRGVGMRLTGYLHLEKEGRYLFQALSNDGIFVYVGDQLLISDPMQHADRLSSIGTLEIVKPGFYPVTVEYFQRKGTAALKLFYQAPESEEMLVVPAEAYWHLPKE